MKYIKELGPELVPDYDRYDSPQYTMHLDNEEETDYEEDYY